MERICRFCWETCRVSPLCSIVKLTKVKKGTSLPKNQRSQLNIFSALTALLKK